eukprot:TRINITY_DN3493_c0_g1_i1.p1 TRINITY_DN3493_c0_g1~~TRINITY_DN3493_c0_g1_i1.p1  ORF type:complete len:265 (-),score=52.51 TRINITY_DN3493_c0_g1_i1:219-1013(-)
MSSATMSVDKQKNISDEKVTQETKDKSGVSDDKQQKDRLSASELESLLKSYPNLRILKMSNYLSSLQATLRDKSTKQPDFVFASDQIIHMLVGEAMSLLPYQEQAIKTDEGDTKKGSKLASPMISVSILRSGEAMETAVRSVIEDIRMGKILIQRDESKAEKPAILFYSKLPSNLETHEILLLDPMLASGGSANAAIRLLVKSGVREDHITFINLISCPEGVKKVFAAYPRIKIITGAVDPILNQVRYICPGLGDFGDRYFGTV